MLIQDLGIKKIKFNPRLNTFILYFLDLILFIYHVMMCTYLV